MNTSKKKKQYTDVQLQTALSAIKEGKMGVSEASKTYNIPKATLHDKINKKYPDGATPGAHTVLTKNEEEQLVTWILYLSNIGFPVTKHNLINTVKNLVENLQRENPFKNGKPGRHWYEGFMARHPELAVRVSQNLTAPRANITEESIRAWFGRIKTYLQKENLEEVLTDPRRIFNCDESAFYLSPKENSVIVKKGSNRVYSRTANDEKECLTVLMTVSADGNMQPPLVLFPYKRTPASIILNMPPKWGIGRSDSGWMTGEAFYEYVTNVFYPWLVENNIDFPVILYLDGHSSHINLPLSEFCREKKIVLIALLPNSTHRLQPLDVAVFRPLKYHWKEHRHTRSDNQHTKLKREDFSKALDICIKNAGLNDAIVNGFRTCGLYPFEPDNIDYNKLIQKVDTEKTEATDLSKKNTRATVSFLAEVEMRIPENDLEEFRMSGDTWLGDPKNHGLFYFWKKVNDDCLQIISDHEEETLNANINILNSCNSDWLANSDVLNLEVQPDGSLALDTQLPCLTENTCEIPNLTESSTVLGNEDNNKLANLITPESQHKTPLKDIESEYRSILTEITDLNESLALDTESTCRLQNTREVTYPAQPLTATKKVNSIPERHFEDNNQPSDVMTPESQQKTPLKAIELGNRSILTEITNFNQSLALETQSTSFLQNTCEVTNPAEFLTAMKEVNLIPEKLFEDHNQPSDVMTPESQHLTPFKDIQPERRSVLTPLKTVTFEDMAALRNKTYSTPGKLQQNSKENCEPSCSKTVIPTPLKNIGTPFKKALFWPGIPKKDNKQNIKKRVIPTVATTEEFINYQKKIDGEKREKERIKEEKKKNKQISSTKDVPPKKRKLTKDKNYTMSDLVEQSTSATNKRNVGDYVVVNYEGELFPGVVTEIKINETLVKTMTMSGLHWKWPNKDDILGYQAEEIVRNIKCPNPINKRGVFSVPEIDELRNNNS